VDIADRLASSGRRAVILPIAGEARRDARFSDLPVEPIALEELGGLMARLKRHRVRLPESKSNERLLNVSGKKQ